MELSKSLRSHGFAMLALAALAGGMLTFKDSAALAASKSAALPDAQNSSATPLSARYEHGGMMHALFQDDFGSP